MTQVDKKEIVDTVVDHIKNNGRSVNEKNQCLYYNEKDGNKCAVGMFLENPEEIQENYCEQSVEAIYDFDELDNCLKDEYQNHGLDFWKQVQYLHDDNENWDDNNNLTNDGVEKYNKILNTFVFSIQLNKDNFV